MPMSDAVSSEDLKTTGIQKGIQPYPLCTEISPVSLEFLMIFTVDYEICKAFAI